MKEIARQDRISSRTSEELRRRYRFNQIELTKEEIDELKKSITTDAHLSATSTNPIQNAAVTQALNNKINKETGKGLSTNDYTDADKEKLEGIPSNAEENVIESISINGVKQEVKDKNVDIKTSSTGEIENTVVLYEDETGTTGDVTLNDNATNYKELEVFGYRADRTVYIKLSPKRMYFDINLIRCVDNFYYFYTKEYSINGNKLSVEYSKLMYLNNEGIPTIYDDTNVYITKVVGHK